MLKSSSPVVHMHSITNRQRGFRLGRASEWLFIHCERGGCDAAHTSRKFETSQTLPFIGFGPFHPCGAETVEDDAALGLLLFSTSQKKLATSRLLAADVFF